MHTVKAYRRGEVQLYSFFASVLDGDEWSNSCPVHTAPWKITAYTH